MQADLKPIAEGETQKWTIAQGLIAILISVAILLDGFDSQIISLTLPAIARDWGLTGSDFAPVVAAGTLGIALGAMLTGAANDRFGRKWSLIASLVLSGLASFACAYATGLISFAVVRTLAGLGLGGALVSATTCLAEFTPKHRRNMVIAFGILCMPLGGFAASLASQAWIETQGWQFLFQLAGALPLLFVPILVVFLPESPLWLLSRQNRRSDDLTVVHRQGGAPITGPDPRDPQPRSTGLRGLFSAEYRRDTLLIWLAFFACLLSIYFVISWLPSLFVASGSSLSLSSRALGFHSLGAMAGSAFTVVVVQWLGTRTPILMTGTMGFGLLVALAFGFNAGLPELTLLFMLASTSFMMACAQSLLYVLVAQVYDAQSRGTGVGFAMAVGRLGAVASAFVGAWALKGGAFQYFLVDAAAVLIMLLALVGVTRHAPPVRRP